MSIEKHIQNYYDVINKDDVAELVLDSIAVPEIKESEKKLLEKYSGVLVFSMNFCGLKSLNNLPKFSELESLDLNDNKIKGEELSKLSIYKNLAKLRLSNNPINTIQEIKVLGQLEHLEILDLVDSPITKLKNFRDEVFKLLPKLQVLDMMYKDGTIYESECDNEEDEDDGEIEDSFLDEEEEDEDDEQDEVEDESEDAKPSKKRKLE